MGTILAGTLELLVLRALRGRELHGYAIAELILTQSEEVLQVEEGALYPALHRLEVRGLVTARWGASENKRRAKYYRLTPAGRRQLEAETAGWRKLARAMGRVLETES